MNTTHKAAALFVLLALALLPMVAGAAPVGIDWDPNPPAEQVSRYVVEVGGASRWEGPETTTQLDLPPGAHMLTVRACNLWGCSEPSVPLQTPGAASPPAGVTITVTVTVR